MARYEFLIDILRSWFAESENSLASRGLSVSLESSPADREKKSLSLATDSAEYVGQLILWDSGEAELETVNIATGHSWREHLELHSVDDLRAALDTLLSRIETNEKS